MTKYIKEEDIDNKFIGEIGGAIKEGKIVVLKTDTVYGMCANAYDKEACKRIYEIKGRPMQKPLCILISDISMLEKVVDFISPLEQKLIDTFWPGPLTIKFKKKENVLPDIVSAGDEFVRVRLLESGLAHEIIKIANVPIVAPSANISGYPTGIKINNIISQLNGKVDYILDSGDVSDDITSTIVEVKDEEVIILREGKIKEEEILKVCN